MRFKLGIATVLLLIAVPGRRATGQTPPPPVLRRPGDTAQSFPLTRPGDTLRFQRFKPITTPGTTTGHAADSTKTGHSARQCPMPVFVPDARLSDRMPIAKLDTVHVERMPIMRDACTNPLQPGTGPR